MDFMEFQTFSSKRVSFSTHCCIYIYITLTCSVFFDTHHTSTSTHVESTAVGEVSTAALLAPFSPVAVVTQCTFAVPAVRKEATLEDDWKREGEDSKVFYVITYLR